MKITKKSLYKLPDIMGEQLSQKEFRKKIEQLDKDMKIAIAKHKVKAKTAKKHSVA